MSDSLYDRYGRSVLKVIVVFLAGTSLASAYYQLTTYGLSGVPDALVSVYIAALIVWGMFYEGFDTFRFRGLLYLGVTLWGTVEVIGNPDATWAYLIVIVGALLLARTGYKEYERRTKPVYER